MKIVILSSIFCELFFLTERLIYLLDSQSYKERESEWASTVPSSDAPQMIAVANNRPSQSQDLHPGPPCEWQGHLLLICPCALAGSWIRSAIPAKGPTWAPLWTLHTRDIAAWVLVGDIEITAGLEHFLTSQGKILKYQIFSFPRLKIPIPSSLVEPKDRGQAGGRRALPCGPCEPDTCCYIGLY